MYIGTLVAGPVAGEPGWTGTCVEGEAEGDVGAEEAALEGDAPVEGPEPDGALDAPAVGEAAPNPLPVGVVPAAGRAAPDEHPATAATSAATVAQATPKRFPIMLLTGITLDVHPESTVRELSMTDCPGYSGIRTRQPR
jgi:hypothetical protein